MNLEDVKKEIEFNRKCMKASEKNIKDLQLKVAESLKIGDKIVVDGMKCLFLDFRDYPNNVELKVCFCDTNVSGVGHRSCLELNKIGWE